MNLIDLLNYRDMSQYRLSKISGVPQSTISDICSNKTDIKKCDAFTLYKIAKVLEVTVEDIFTKEIDVVDYQDFEVYKSNVCHLYKGMEPIKFVNEILEKKYIESNLKEKQFAKAFYLIGFVDYVCNKNKLGIPHEFDEIRNKSLLNRIYPYGVLILDNLYKTDKHSKTALKEAILEILRFNIVESQIENIA